MIPASFEYRSPASVADALCLLQEEGDIRVLAGGQSLVPLMKLRLARPMRLVDLRRIHGLSYIRQRRGYLAIGAMTTYQALESSPLLRRRAPMLSDAASLIGDLQVRNMGTVGGSVSHADPAADLPAVLLALDAGFLVMNQSAAREIPASSFFVDAFQTALEERELLTEIKIPSLAPGNGGSYEKFANKASRFAIVGVAASITTGPRGIARARIGVTGAGTHAVRAESVERHLVEHQATNADLAAAAGMVLNDISFQADVHGSAEFRAALTRLLIVRAVSTAMDRATGRSDRRRQ